MQTISLWEYVQGALIAPLGVPVVLVLMGRWRYPKNLGKGWAVAGLYVVLAALNAAVYFALGRTMAAAYIVIFASLAICWVTYVVFSTYRDGRLVFSMVTGVLVCSVNETLACVFTRSGTLAGVIVRVSISVCMTLFLGLVLRRPYLRMLSVTVRGWVRMSVLPFSLFLCMVTAFQVPTDEIVTPYPNPLPPLVMCLSVFAIYIAIYFALTSLRQQQIAEKEQAVLVAQVRQLQQQVELYLDSDGKNRTFRHDMRHFITMMQGCMAKGDWAALGKILAAMGAGLDELSQAPLHRYTGDAIIDTVLSMAAEKARQAGVEFTVQLTLPKQMRVDAAELAVVISNELENALAACGEAGADAPRWISVTGSRQTNQFFLSIANSCPGSVVFDDESGLPVASENGHGYGVQSILAFARKYNAMLDFSHEDGVFTLSILI